MKNHNSRVFRQQKEDLAKTTYHYSKIQMAENSLAHKFQENTWILYQCRTTQEIIRGAHQHLVCQSHHPKFLAKQKT